MPLGRIAFNIRSFFRYDDECVSTLVLFLLLATSLFCLPAKAKYGGGTGEPNDPYLIYDANQMNAIGAETNDWDKHFKLAADIDLGSYGGEQFNIIGIDYDHPFTGVFDGNGHAILNFTYTSARDGGFGLFGCLEGPDAEIKDLRLIDPNVESRAGVGSVGSLVGSNSGKITNCLVENANVFSDGGLSGTGGLVGVNYGTIANCCSTGDVNGLMQIGGLVGFNIGTISNCYSSANVSWMQVIGGLVGLNDGTITHCYSTGNVSGCTATGGLVAGNRGTVTDCFWDVNTTGQTTSAGGSGKTTAEMQMQSTFTNWDFDNVWTICEGRDYPRLRWEKYGGGGGTADDPYLIRTSRHMQAIGAQPNDWDKHFKLTADIDLGSYTGTQFNIIGTGENQPFSGSFDGNGHTISNFSYFVEHAAYIGLFGYVNGPNAQIKDLRLIDPNVDAGTGWHVGSLVGSLEHGTISGCGVAGGNILASGPVGGFVGANANGTITSCWCSGSVSGGQGVGGLAGANVGTITNCYSSTNTSGAVVVGGLAGFNASRIANCYAVGTTYGLGVVGGLVASDCEGAGTAEHSFWDVNSTGQTTSAGGIPKTTAEMQMRSTFANWDFVSTWHICEATNYPRLVWQIPPADFICPDGVQMNDFAVLAAQWQQPPGQPSADIAPHGGDGIVDWLDLAVLANTWLSGL